MGKHQLNPLNMLFDLAFQMKCKYLENECKIITKQTENLTNVVVTFKSQMGVYPLSFVKH